MSKNVLIGLAWPYANSSLHLGHVAGLISGDVLARYHRLKGDNVLMVSGTDCYGTPIILEALKQEKEPLQIAEKYHQEFCECLVEKLNFSYDLYTHTMTENHAQVVQDLFLDLYEKDYIYSKKEKALYCSHLKMFLPDRFVEGTCPKCGFEEARGDQCDECGELLDPLELKNPKANKKIFKEGASVRDFDRKLEVKTTEHFYLKLSAMQKGLEKHTQEKSTNWRPNVKGIVDALFQQGLKDRAVTRDIDWGVPIPIDGYEDKRIYVWFDAVTGYLSASKLWAKEKGEKDAWENWWKDKDALHYYVHGKDNVPFHAVIWAGMLYGQGELHLPDSIVSSEYLLLKNKQFSKSRGWAILLPDFLERFNPETLRFFLTANGPETGDINFSWDLFAEKVNTELIGTMGNLFNRTLAMTKGRFKEGVRLPTTLDEESVQLLKITEDAFAEVGEMIEKGKIKMAFKQVFEVAENANRYIDKKAPWHKVKEEETKEEAEHDLAVVIHVIRSLAVLTNPFLPEASEKVHRFLGIPLEESKWQYPSLPKSYKVKELETVYQPITEEQVKEENERLEK